LPLRVKTLASLLFETIPFNALLLQTLPLLASNLIVAIPIAISIRRVLLLTPLPISIGLLLTLLL